MKTTNIRFIYIFAFLYFFYFSTIIYLKWNAHSPSLDYHAYLQMYWNTANGDFLMYNRASETQYTLFSTHFSPFLLMIFPVYLIFSHPLTLYFVFGFVISLSFIPLYFFALDKLKSRLSALLIILSFYLYFPFSWTHRHGFAEEAFATPLLLFAVYFLHKNRPWLYVIFSFLTLSLRVNMVIPVFLLGVYSVIKNKSRKQGVFICSLSLFWLIYTLSIIYPKHTVENIPFYVYGFFGNYGRNLREIATNILSDPSKMLQTLTSESRLKYVEGLFGPVLFLSFLSPDVLFIGVPILLLNMLASYTRLGSLWTYYHASSLPFIWLALIVTLQRLGNLWERLSQKLTIKLNKTFVINILLAVIFVKNYNIIKLSDNGIHYPFSETFNMRTYERNQRDDTADAILTTIPKTNSVATQHSYLEHTAERKWQFPTSNFSGYYPDIVLFDSWASSAEFKLVPDNNLYSKIWEDSFFFLYSRSDLLKNYNIKDFVYSTYKNYNESFDYLALVNPKESSVFYSSLEPQISIDVNSKYYLVQKLEIQKDNPSVLEIPVEKENLFGANDLLHIGEKRLGNLKADILEGSDFKANYKVLFSGIYKFEDLTHKTNLIRINLNDLKIAKSKTYWLMLSLDTNRKNEQEKINSYKTFIGTPDRTVKSNKDGNDDTNVYYSFDSGKKWSSDAYPDKKLVYAIYYGNLVTEEKGANLENGSIIISGTPWNIKNQLENLLNYESDYNSVVIIGSVTEIL